MGTSPSVTVLPTIAVSPNALTVSPSIVVSPGGVSSVTISDPAADSIFIVNMAIEVSGTAVGSGSIYATFDAGPSRGTGTAGGGTFTVDVTAVTADIGATELQIRRTIDDVVIGTLACTVLQAALWAPTNDVLGTVGTSSAAITRDVTTWSQTNLTPLGGQTDPESGGTAYKLTESTDGALANHFIYGTWTNSADSYADFDVWLQPQGRDWIRFSFGISAYGYVNVSTGTEGTLTADVTATLVESVGTWQHWKFTSRAIPSSNRCYIWSIEVDNTPQYQGDGREALRVWLPDDATGGLAQTRLQTVADKSGTDADLTQGTAAVQQLYQASFAALAGLPTALHEAGRSAYMSSTKAALLAACNGADTPNLVAGITRLSATVGCETPWWFDGASDYYIPLHYNGTNNWNSVRHTGAVSSSQSFPGVTDVMVAAARTYCVIFNRLGDLKSELYLDGVLVSTTAAHASCTLATTTFYNSSLNSTADLEYADCVVLPSAHTYAAARAMVKAMCKPYNDAVPGSLTF